MTTQITDILDSRKVLESLVRVLIMENLSKKGSRFKNCYHILDINDCLTESFMIFDSISQKALIIDFFTNGDFTEFEQFINDIKEKFTKSPYYNIYTLKHDEVPEDVNNFHVKIHDGLFNILHDSVFSNSFKKESFHRDYSEYMDKIYKLKESF